ncbi:hypothetical protein E4U21_002890 [Claviceps maximensis]|nr:hypothetical protein E4U21_002890 [Claviceps maximensis]
MPHHECLSTHLDALAASTTCGDVHTVSRCLISLSRLHQDRVDQADLQECFLLAGCSASLADQHANNLIRRCNDMTPQAYELKKRRPVDEPSAPAPTSFDASQSLPPSTASPSPTPTPAPPPPPNNNKHGHDCFKYGITSTRSCLSETLNGKVKDKDCKYVPVTTSDCLRGYICTLDSVHQDVCMQAHNSLDTSGIIIAIVFGTFIVMGLGYLTFACFQERKQHRRSAAKALARATTMKQMKQRAQNARAQDVHAPLIQQPHKDVSNPFHDDA